MLARARVRVAMVVAAILAAPRVALAAPSVWAIDDGEKIKEDATSLAFETGAQNPVWSPGQPIRLFAMRNETVALQIVVEADDDALGGVTVDLDTLAAPAGEAIANATGATDPTRFVGRPIERFVEHFLTIARPSGGKTPRESIGWTAGSGPSRSAWTGRVPDALIPIEVAPPWAPYPMHVAPHSNAIVWIDVTTSKTQGPGVYTGVVVVKSGARQLAALPIELRVEDVVLPDRLARTMLFYDRAELDRRIGGGDAVEEHLWMLLHRHRIAPMHSVKTVSGVEHQLPALDGSEYSAAHGYEGPAIGVGDGVLAIGAYGSLGAPSEGGLATVSAIADRLASGGALESTDVFVYAIDEECDSSYGRDWKALLSGSTNASTKRVRVGWTCSEDPARQPVDVPMVLGPLEPSRISAAHAAGKEVWLYNGERPFEGTFLTDSEAISPRVNAWIGAMFGVGRWFYWESTFWYDDNRGGHGAYDPFAQAETFHNDGTSAARPRRGQDEGDYAMGDGVLVYPGRQVDGFEEHSIGMRGVIASIRLKNWRRGIEDAGYYELARGADAAKADAIARALVPRALGEASAGEAPSYGASGKSFFDARRALLALIPRGQDRAVMKPADPGGAWTTRRGACCPRGCGAPLGSPTGSAGLFAFALFVCAGRRRARSHTATSNVVHGAP